MISITLQYLLFTGITIFLFYNVSPKLRKWLLILSGYLFYYYCNPQYVLLLFGMSVTTYFLALSLDKLKKRKVLLVFGIIILFFPLIFFKYYDLLTANFFLIFDLTKAKQFNLIYPIGISFFTFQMVGYVMDVKRGYLQPEKNFGKVLLHHSFFPIILAGPIERGKNLLSQFTFNSVFNYTEVRNGLILVLWGLFKKIVISGNIAVFVDSAYDSSSLYSSFSLWLAMLLFSFQIFTDFSAYSDIAMGTAKAFGVNVTKNFNDRVYASISRTQFWKGWHRSMTSWFRDYVFLPLSKRKKTKLGLYFNLLLVFLLIGIWHGASWGYVLWGLLNGTWLVIEQSTQMVRFRFFYKVGINLKSKLFRLVAWFTVFNFGALTGIFFKSESVGKAISYLSRIFSISHGDFPAIPKRVIIVSLVAILFMDLVNRLKGENEVYDLLFNRSILLRWGFYILLILSILYLQPLSVTDFYYFRF